MRSDARGDEADFLEGLRIDQVHSVGHHVGDIEDASVRRAAHVLGHAALGQFQHAEDFAIAQVDLGDGPAELTGEDGVVAAGREVGVIDPAASGGVELALQLHGVGIAELQPAPGLGDHDGGAAVGGEVHVVGVRDRDRADGLGRLRIDLGQAAGDLAGGAARHP